MFQGLDFALQFSFLSSQRHGDESDVVNLNDSGRLPSNLKDTNINFTVAMKVGNGNLTHS